jgi:hypothetical protein
MADVLGSASSSKMASDRKGKISVHDQDAIRSHASRCIALNVKNILATITHWVNAARLNVNFAEKLSSLLSSAAAWDKLVV